MKKGIIMRFILIVMIGIMMITLSILAIIKRKNIVQKPTLHIYSDTNFIEKISN